MRYMLDTNICIYVIKTKPEKVFKKLQTIRPEDVCISSVTYAELVHGVEKSAAVRKTDWHSPCFWRIWRFWILTWMRLIVMERLEQVWRKMVRRSDL